MTMRPMVATEAIDDPVTAPKAADVAVAVTASPPGMRPNHLCMQSYRSPAMPDLATICPM